MRQYALIALVVALLALSGCGGDTKQPNITDPFIGGNIAVNLYLQNGAPPPMVYDGGKFPFGINIVFENVGEADIGEGTLSPYISARLENVNPSLFGVTEADLFLAIPERINGARKNFDGTILPGMLTNIIFPQLNFQKRLAGNDMITLRGVVCYDYANIATTQICLKSDMLENVQDSTLCSLTGEKLVHNSGGPIHVTHVVQNPLGPNKIMTSFQIEHVGPGEFYGRSDTEDCNPSVKNSNKFKVDLEVSVQDPAATVQCYRLQNSNAGQIVMYGGAPQTISCTITGGSTSRVTTDILEIRSFYRYGQFIEQPIVIQAVPE